MNNNRIAAILALMAISASMAAQEPTVDVHGTIRSKFEYQTSEEEARFEVRNARFSLSGNVTPNVAYKAEIDLSDEGSIKMLDAYTRITPAKKLNFTIGQFRVPFTIDAHRSPHQQYFANRSFIAKQVGNVRDVGMTVGYTFDAGFPIIVEAGLFNGSGLTGQKDYWTKSVNYSAKAQLLFPGGIGLVASTQKIRPNDLNIYMYDLGLYYHTRNLHVEAEYLYKTYSHQAYDDVHSVDAFASYTIPLKREKWLIKSISPLVRYDYMTDHSDGSRGDDNKLYTTDHQRSRLTGGVTFSLAKPFVSDIRLNYEKYFYKNGVTPKTSERDKIVLEVMTRF